MKIKVLYSEVLNHLVYALAMDTQVYIFDSPYILQKKISYKSILKSVRF